MVVDLNEVNKRITDRSDCFYWQTDRKISAEEAAEIWKDRHSAISNEELLIKVNNHLNDIKLAYIKPFDINAQTSLGNVNSARVGVLENGQEVIIRCHPKGVENGYFHVESLASAIALENGIPAYKTYCVHDLENEDDVAYQVIEKLDGDTVQFFLREHSDKEQDLVYDMGKTMAKMHKIKVEGFGPFDNEAAKNGKLQGIHDSLSSSVNAGLEENLERLVKYNIITDSIALKIKSLFENNELLNTDEAVLVHNDFADWNLLTDGSKITGVLDWDECVGGHPVQEIACWSTFFSPDRIKTFLQGYFSETKQPDNFEKMFQLMRLRYTVSKMALRIKRYTYERSPFLKDLLNKGQQHLDELSEIFGLEEQR